MEMGKEDMLETVTERMAKVEQIVRARRKGEKLE
jgi:hypothetical protein